MIEKIDIVLTVNGRDYAVRVEPRRTLVDAIREDCGLTGTHIGCEHGVCGTCTVIVDGDAVRSCLMFAVQANGKPIRTVEGLADGDNLHPLQQAFIDHHGLQCGYCTPGFLMLATNVLEKNPAIGDDELLDVLSSNLCRCTGYQNIIKAVRAVAAQMRGETVSAHRRKSHASEAKQSRGRGTEAGLLRHCAPRNDEMRIAREPHADAADRLELKSEIGFVRFKHDRKYDRSGDQNLAGADLLAERTERCRDVADDVDEAAGIGFEVGGCRGLGTAARHAAGQSVELRPGVGGARRPERDAAMKYIARKDYFRIVRWSVEVDKLDRRT